MTKVMVCLLCLSLSLAGLTSCSDNDEDFPPTGENGRLSRAQYGDDSLYFSYAGNKISQTQINKDFVTEFIYENGQLSGLSMFPIDSDIVDLDSRLSFTREGNKIKVKHWGELRFELEIELDEHDLPVKITEMELFTNQSGTIEQQTHGEYYALLEFDPDTKNLLKQVVYSFETSERVASYTYEYADTPGIMSKVDLPLWFFAYKNYQAHMSAVNYGMLYFNHSGNLVKVIADDSRLKFYGTKEIQYEYNKAGFPIKMFSVPADEKMPYINIRY